MPNRISGSSPQRTSTANPESAEEEKRPSATAPAASWAAKAKNLVGWGTPKNGASAKAEKAAPVETQAERRGKLSAIADAQVQGMLSLRSPNPRELSGVSLGNEVGAALNLRPDHLPLTAEDKAKFEAGAWDFYTADSKKAVGKVAAGIEAVGGKNAKVTVLPIALHPEGAGGQPMVLPLFRVETDRGPKFVDNQGRQYKSLQDWKDNNLLPPGDLSYPKDGKLQRDASGRAQLVTEASHAVVDTLGEKALKYADTAVMVGGFVVGAAAIIGTGGLATPIAGAVLAAWSAGRGAAGLWDSASHGASINPVTDEKARGDWLSFASGALGLGASGSMVSAAGQMAKSGQVVGAVAKLAPELNVASQVVGTADTVNGGVSLAKHWDEMPMSQKLLSVSQMVFAGASTGHALHKQGLRGLYSPQAVREQLGMAPPKGAGQAAPKLAMNQKPTDAERLSAHDFFGETTVQAPDAAPTTNFGQQLSSPSALKRLRESPELNLNGQRARLQGARLVGRNARSDGDFRYAYGRDAFNAWANADAHLNQIPKGKLAERLSVELLSEVNKRAYVAGDDSALAKAGHAFRAVRGEGIQGGRLRDYDSRSLPWKPASMDEVKNVRANGAEISLVHTGDVGEVAILYPKHETVQPRLTQLIQDTQAALKAPDADVVKIGAEFSQRFVSLHPFQDGNGRTARLMMDRILAEHDVPPPILRDLGADVALTRGQYVDEVRAGVKRMQTQLEAYDVTGGLDKKFRVLGRSPLQAEFARAVKSVDLDGAKWTQGGDGLVYDTAGRAYAATPEGQLRPMTQLEHYFALRRIGQAKDPRAAAAEFSQGTAAAFAKLEANPQEASKLLLSDLDAIRADNQYQLKLGPSGNEALVGLFDPAKADPAKLFAPSTGSGDSKASFLMSRYQQLDLEMWHTMRGLKAGGDVKGAAAVMGHRQKLFELARGELQKLAPATTTPDNPLGFTKSFEKLSFENSPLRHASLAEAIRVSGDDDVRVWRGDVFAVEKVGIYPDYLPNKADAFDLAQVRERSHGTGSMVGDLDRVAGSSLGTGYLCYTSDPALLAKSGGFADKQNTATLNLNALPESVRGRLKAKLTEVGTLRVSDVSDLLGAAFRTGKVPEGAVDVGGLSRAQFDNLVKVVGQGWTAEQRAKVTERFVAAQSNGSSLASAFGEPVPLPVKDLFQNSWEWSSLSDAVSRTRGAIELKLAPSGDAVELKTSRRAFLVDMKKEHALPGINALGGGSYEFEQEITGLGRVFPHRIVGSLSQSELAAPLAPGGQ